MTEPPLSPLPIPEEFEDIYEDLLILKKAGHYDQLDMLYCNDIHAIMKQALNALNNPKDPVDKQIAKKQYFKFKKWYENFCLTYKP